MSHILSNELAEEPAPLELRQHLIKIHSEMARTDLSDPQQVVARLIQKACALEKVNWEHVMFVLNLMEFEPVLQNVEFMKEAAEIIDSLAE